MPRFWLTVSGVSYAVNHNRSNSDNYLFAVAKVKSNGPGAKDVDANLFKNVIGRSIAPFVAAALEHTAIGGGFGNRNNYVPDISQELCYLVVVNVVNSSGPWVLVARCHEHPSTRDVKSVRLVTTTVVVLITIFELIGALYWIPKAVLATTVIAAIWPLMGT